MMTMLLINYIPWGVAFVTTRRRAREFECGAFIYGVMACVCILSILAHFYLLYELSVLLFFIDYIIMLLVLISYCQPDGLWDYLTYFIAGLGLCFSALLGSHFVALIAWGTSLS